MYSNTPISEILVRVAQLRQIIQIIRIALPHDGRKISADIKQRALELLEKGWEMEEVTEALGVSSRSVDR